MFILRQQHLDAFSEAAKEGFEDRMVSLLYEKFPDECEQLGERGVRRRICTGVERAAQYEIDTEADVAVFIRLMFGISPTFDTDSETAWTAEILQDQELSASERLEQIRHEARIHGVQRLAVRGRLWR